MKEMTKAPGVPVFIPIRAESKTHSCVLILKGKLMVNLIDDGNQWCSWHNNQMAKSILKSDSSRNVVKTGSLAQVTVALFLWKYTWMAATAPQVELQMKDQCDKC